MKIISCLLMAFTFMAGLAAGQTLYVEDNFAGHSAGDLFVAGDGVGQFPVGAGGTPEFGAWQSNQTGPTAPTSDGNTNITLVAFGAWDQYVDSRMMSQMLDNGSDVAMLALITLNDADIFFGFADVSMSNPNGVRLTSSSGAITIVDSATGSPGTDTGLSFNNNSKFGIMVTRLSGGAEIKVATHNLASGTPTNPADSGWTDSGQNYLISTPTVNQNVMFNAWWGGGGSYTIDYVKMVDMPATGGPTPEPTPTPTPIPTVYPDLGTLILEDDFRSPAGLMPALGIREGFMEFPFGNTDFGEPNAGWTSNQTVGENLNAWDGATTLEMPMDSFFVQYIDSRNSGISIEPGNVYAFVAVFTMPSSGAMAMGILVGGDHQNPDLRAVSVDADNAGVISLTNTVMDNSGDVATGRSSLLGAAQSLGMLIDDTDNDGTADISVYYNNGVAKNARFNNPGMGWMNITPSGSRTRMPVPISANVGVNTRTDSPDDVFRLDYILLVQDPQLFVELVNTTLYWTLY